MCGLSCVLFVSWGVVLCLVSMCQLECVCVSGFSLEYVISVLSCVCVCPLVGGMCGLC